MTVKDWRDKREAIRKDQREKMQSILTNDQKAQLEKSRMERGPRRKNTQRHGWKK
jgi:hypothetical protein